MCLCLGGRRHWQASTLTTLNKDAWIKRSGGVVVAPLGSSNFQRCAERTDATKCPAALRSSSKKPHLTCAGPEIELHARLGEGLRACRLRMILPKRCKAHFQDPCQ